MDENVLLTDKHMLICIGNQFNPIFEKELEYIKQYFCGKVFTDLEPFLSFYKSNPVGFVYMCGDIDLIYRQLSDIKERRLFIINRLSWSSESFNSELNGNIGRVDIGEIPINYHGLGVYFRKLFSSEEYFENISQEHHFQSLTESNKPGSAFRKGIYLTKVEDYVGDNCSDIRFNLLRCSSNLSGPSDNFRETDMEIVGQVNDISKYFFKEPTELNHVLAQIYENKLHRISDSREVQRKAKIKAHSDKTKDMPRNGLIAFCTFYRFDPNIRYQRPNDIFDICYSGISVLTRLHFQLKSSVRREIIERCHLPSEFTITLYPNSVFIIPLSTNRLYTHEIRPSVLPIEKIPTRMGYVIRCSKTRAIHKNGETFLDENGKMIKMESITDSDRSQLRELYFQENLTDNIIEYCPIYFSMNSGDYLKPIL